MIFNILVKVTDSKIFRICGGILLVGLIVAPWAWVGVLLNEDKAETEIENGSEIDKVLFNNKLLNNFALFATKKNLKHLNFKTLRACPKSNPQKNKKN